MITRLLLPDPFTLSYQGLNITPDRVAIRARAATEAALCPSCGQPSSRIHSRYTRTLGDLPWQGRPVRLELETRRFFCGTPDCVRRIFSERLPEVASTHARKTARLVEALRRIGFACGGEAGSRLAGHLGMSASADVILDLVRHAPSDSFSTPRVLGVDDWAWHKGQRYGTILCDLEQHRPVDLLAERSAESLESWLRAHPDVEVISRDRGAYYAQGASAGAPKATQVADRWHLMHNLQEALVRMLDRHHRDLSEATRDVAAAAQPPPQQMADRPTQAAPAPSTPTRAQQASEVRRTRRLERYSQVVALREQGVPMREIARQMEMHRGTVRKFVRGEGFPERAKRRSVKRTDPFVAHLRHRWEEGCHRAVQLFRELAEQGFDGSYYMVRRQVAAWRNGTETGGPDPDLPVSHRTITERPSANRVAWMVLENPEDRSLEDQAFLDALWQRCPELKTAADLAQAFCRMVRERQVELLDNWVVRTHDVGVPRELGVFADGLKLDYAAVKAALSLPWSNGQVEGQINRLKLIKRQMYGRGGFDLLRQRVLHTGSAP